MAQQNWRVLPDPDGGWYAALLHNNGTPSWRSLTTFDRAKAQRWLKQARCHGSEAHTQTCEDCEPHA